MTRHLIGHFTVMDGSEAEGDLALIQTFLLYHVNQFILMLTSIFQEQFPTVKWPISMEEGTFFPPRL